MTRIPERTGFPKTRCLSSAEEYDLVVYDGTRACTEHKKLALHLGLGSVGVLTEDLMDRGLVACTATDAHDATLRVPRHME